MAENAKGVGNGIGKDTEWESNFKNKHVSDATSDQFIASYRTVIYARQAKSNGEVEKISDIGATAATEFHAIGVVQAYNWGESRNIDYIFELGSDIPYLVPGRTIGQISLQRIMLNGSDIVKALYNEPASDNGTTTAGATSSGVIPLTSIKDITVPFDLMFVAFPVNGTGENKYSRVFKNCQIESRNESIQAGAVILAESVNIRYEAIVGVTLPETAATKK